MAKKNELTDEERERLLREFTEQREANSTQVSIKPTTPTVAQARNNTPDYVTTGINAASTDKIDAEDALHRLKSKTASPVSNYKMQNVDGGGGRIETGAEPEDPRTPAATAPTNDVQNAPASTMNPDDYPGVMRDHLDTIDENHINMYYYRLLQAKIQRGEVPTPADYLNAFLDCTVESAEAQSAKVQAMVDEYGGMEGYIAARNEEERKKRISDGTDTDYSDSDRSYIGYESAAESKKQSRTLDEIYQEYLNSQYYQNAIAEGKRLAEDVLGKYASMTGGMPSTAATYAATAAGQQSDRNAQNYLWELAQKQYRNEQEDAAAETEKYSTMIDNFLKMGYGVDQIPDEWWAKAEYDSKYAKGLSDYMAKMNDTSADAASGEQEFYSSLLNKYISEGRYGEIPDELFTRAGYTEEQAAAMKNYYAGSGAATSTAKAGKPYSEWKTEDFESADKYTESALKKYKNGNDWEGYISTLDDSVGEYVYEYLANHAPMKLREWKKLDNGTYTDEFGNEYGKDALISALVSEGMKEADAKTFVKNIKAYIEA